MVECRVRFPQGQRRRAFSASTLEGGMAMSDNAWSAMVWDYSCAVFDCAEFITEGRVCKAHEGSFSEPVSLRKPTDDMFDAVGFIDMRPEPAVSSGFRFMMNAIPDGVPVMQKTVTYFGSRR